MRLFVAILVCIQACSVFGEDCPPDICPSDETCCPGPSTGMYGCCPSPNAVCCSDGQHCCPQDTVCNLVARTCDAKTDGIPLIFQKRPPTAFQAVEMKEAEKIEVVYCPGGTSYCPDGNTCCMLPSGQYGCCPYPSASCCFDRIHCCPYGTRCDPTSQFCLQADTKLPVAPKRRRPLAMLIQQ